VQFAARERITEGVMHDDLPHTGFIEMSVRQSALALWPLQQRKQSG
jgi:hypothetical protein